MEGPITEHPMLREVLERAESDRRTLVVELAKRFGYLPYMISRYLELLGYQETLELLRANERPMPEYLRCSDHLIECEKLEKRLRSKGVVTLHDPKFSPLAYKVVESRISPGATHEYLMGYYFLQGPASMSIVHALEPMPGERIIDMAAAPGGKATQILQLTRDRSLLVAVEVNRKRVKSLRANLQRLRLSKYIILRADSTRLSFSGTFDRVLLDAPSTGEGIIRKDPARKRSRLPQDLVFIHRVQVRMLRRALQYVKPGGTVVYAACTLAPEEGEMVIDTVLRSMEGSVDVEPLPIDLPSPGVTKYFDARFDDRVRLCGRYWPHRHGSEGFFVCRLRKLPD